MLIKWVRLQYPVFLLSDKMSYSFAIIAIIYLNKMSWCDFFALLFETHIYLIYTNISILKSSEDFLSVN